MASVQGILQQFKSNRLLIYQAEKRIPDKDGYSKTSLVKVTD